VDPKTGNPDWDGTSDFVRLIRATVAAHLRRLNPEEFITGMALGVDQWTACDAWRLGVPVILAAIPCLHHESRWPEPSRIKYHKILALPRVVSHVVSERPYFTGCMQARNEFMVDRAQVLIAVWNGTSGGTANCVEYARKQGREVIIVNPSTLIPSEGGKPVMSFKEDPYKFLSNMTRCPDGIKAHGYTYPTVEHAFQASKCVNPEWHARVAAVDDPYLVKKMARNELSMYGWNPRWDLARRGVMHALLLQKFSVEPFKALLLNTGDRELVEGNWWHDNYWGVCTGRGGRGCNRCENEVPTKGENVLGKLLMDIRAKLRG
jgi:ribA/ribD-fused uncharacterized protein